MVYALPTRIVFSMDKLWNSNYIKVWSSNFLLNFAFMLVVPLLPIYLSERFSADKDTIGMVLSGYAVAALCVRPFSGYIVDSFPRKAVLLICYFLTTALFAGYLIAGSLTMFAIFRTIHGAPFGATGVSLSTVAVDVLPSSRRTEGIGYYGLSNNIATAISPSVALWLFAAFHSYDLLFSLSLLCSLLGLIVDASLQLKPRPVASAEGANASLPKPHWSLDRFFLLRGWALFFSMFTFAFSYGVVSTFVAIYGKERLGITGGTGLFFALLAIGLIVSRLTGAKSLRKGRVVQNASAGMVVSVFGYAIFAGLQNEWGYYLAPFIIGLGNGHMWPAFQNMFINLAENNQRGTANSTILTSWDLGMGVGMLMGGIVAEHLGYSAAFWTATAVNILGVVFYFVIARPHFIRYRLR